MKKKIIITAACVAGLAFAIMIPKGSVFAASALSIFRVDDMKTINITLDDIGAISAYMQENKEQFEEHQSKTKSKAKQHAEPDYQTLSNVADFEAFSVKLPKELKGETPELYATGVSVKSFPMEDGGEVSVSISPTFMAKYEKVTFSASQGVAENMPLSEKQALLQKLMEQPMLTENIRTQLAGIDLSGKDIYLPVIAGVSREADLGGTTGYLYSTSDLQSIMSALPAEFADKMKSESGKPNETVLVWTKNGVLYMLTSELSDSDLVKIARSVR